MDDQRHKQPPHPAPPVPHNKIKCGYSGCSSQVLATNDDAGRCTKNSVG